MIKAITYLAFLFMISELMLTVSKRSDAKESVKRRDRGSMLLIWIVIPASLTAGFFLARYKMWGLWNYYFASAGMVIYLAGMIIRWLAIFQLKGAFTVDVAVNPNQVLKTDGLYKRIRHPSYLGLLLILTGLSVSMNSILSFVVVTIPVFLAIYYRINVEEKLLLEFFGEKYLEYSIRTSKLFPFVF